MKKKHLVPVVLSALFLLTACGPIAEMSPEASSSAGPVSSSTAASSSVLTYSTFTLEVPALMDTKDTGIQCTFTLSPTRALPDDATFQVYEEGDSKASSRLFFDRLGVLRAAEAGEFTFQVGYDYAQGKRILSNKVTTKVYPAKNQDPEQIDWTDLRLGYHYFSDNSKSLHRYTYVIPEASKSFIQENGNGGVQIVGVGMGSIEIHDIVENTTLNHRFVVANTLITAILREVLNLPSQNLTSADLAKVTELNIDGKLRSDPQMAFAVRVLPNLEKLSMTNCGLNTIAFLADLQHLTSLDFSGNSITNVDLLDAFASTLQEARFAHNKIADVAKAFAYYEGSPLRVADFSYNALTSCKVFGNILALESLELSGNPIAEVNDLGSLSALVHLGLAYTDLSFNSIMSLGFLKSLTYLDVSGVKSIDLDSFKKADLSKLITFKMADCNISDYTAETGLVSFLKNYADLRELSIGGNGLNDTALGDIARLTKLTSLDLSNSPLTGDQSRNHFTLGGLTHLSTLSLQNCHNVTDVTLFTGLTQLVNLNLSGCYSLEQIAFLKNNPLLANLHLEYTLGAIDAEGWSTINQLMGDDPAAPKINVYFFEDSIVHPGEYAYFNNFAAFKGNCTLQENGNKLYYNGTGKKLIVSFVNENYNGDKWWSPKAAIYLPKNVIEINYVVKKDHYADSFTTETLDRTNDCTINFISDSMRWGRDGFNNFVYYHGSGDMILGFYGASHSYYTSQIYLPAQGRAADHTNGAQGTMGYTTFRSQAGITVNVGVDTLIKGGKGQQGQQAGYCSNLLPFEHGSDGGKGGTGGYALEAEKGPILVRQLHGAKLELIGGDGGDGGKGDPGSLGGIAGNDGAQGDQGQPANQKITTYDIA